MKSKAKILKYFSIVNFVRVYEIESYDLRNIKSFEEKNKLASLKSCKMIHNMCIKYYNINMKNQDFFSKIKGDSQLTEKMCEYFLPSL